MTLFWPAVCVVVAASIASIFPVSVSVAAAVGLAIYGVMRWPLFAVALVLIAAVAGEWGRIHAFGVSFLSVDIVAAAVSVVVIFKAIVKNTIKLQWPLVALLLYMLALLVSFLAAGARTGGIPTEAALQLLRHVALMGLWVVGLCTPKEKGIWLVVAACVGLAATGFWQLHAIPDFTAGGLTAEGFDPHIQRLTGLWLDPNYAAIALSFCISVVGGYTLQHLQEKKKAAVGVLIATVLLAALVATVSRSGLLALMVAGMVLSLLQNKRLLVVGAAVVLLVMLLHPGLKERVVLGFDSAKNMVVETERLPGPTAQLRVLSWQDGLRIVKEHPLLGVGFGSYKQHQQFSSNDSHAATGNDSSLLFVSASSGLLGLIAFIYFWGVTVACLLRKKQGWHMGYVAGVSGLMAGSFFVNAFFFAPLMAVVYLTAGLMYSKEK